MMTVLAAAEATIASMTLIVEYIVVLDVVSVDLIEYL